MFLNFDKVWLRVGLKTKTRPVTTENIVKTYTIYFEYHWQLCTIQEVKYQQNRTPRKIQTEKVQYQIGKSKAQTIVKQVSYSWHGTGIS